MMKRKYCTLLVIILISARDSIDFGTSKGRGKKFISQNRSLRLPAQDFLSLEGEVL